jgi:hypothetical protein
MNNDEWLRQNHPDFTPAQIHRFKDLVQMFYGYELQTDSGTADIERCRAQAINEILKR